MHLCAGVQRSYAVFHRVLTPEEPMVVCPIAIAVGCKKCPAFSFCPAKSTLGDYKPEPPAASKPPAKEQ